MFRNVTCSWGARDGSRMRAPGRGGDLEPAGREAAVHHADRAVVVDRVVRDRVGVTEHLEPLRNRRDLAPLAQCTAADRARDRRDGPGARGGRDQRAHANGGGERKATEGTGRREIRDMTALRRPREHRMTTQARPVSAPRGGTESFLTARQSCDARHCQGDEQSEDPARPPMTTPARPPRPAVRSSPSRTGTALEHVGAYSFEPAALPGNVEHFTGAAQVPIGLAGPILVDGEHAQGEFYVPLATTEGTLVASYNRGMKLVRLAGGVKTTVVKESMQRAPVFMFESAPRGPGVPELAHRARGRCAPRRRIDTSTASSSRSSGTYAGRFCFTRFRLHDGRRRRARTDRQATWAACRMDQGELPRRARLRTRGQPRDRQEALPDNNLQTRGRRVNRRDHDPRPPAARGDEHLQRALYRRRQISGQVGAWLSGR